MKQNPNWIRTTISSILLAIVLRVGLHVPFLTTFITIAVIYLTHVVMVELSTGVATAKMWLAKARDVGMGVVIFLALRYIAAQVIGLYPIDTYRALDSGGLYGILPAHEVSKTVMFEILFALAAGGLSVAWVNGKRRGLVGTIFGISLLIVGFQVATPKYAATWPNRDQVSTNLVHHGVVGTTVKAGWRFLFGAPEPTKPKPTNNTPRLAAEKVTSASASASAPTPAQRPMSLREITIPPSGVALNLSPGWRGFTQGGAINITLPDGRVVKDQPGVPTDLGMQPEGIYIFMADPPGSFRKIVIHNRW